MSEHANVDSLDDALAARIAAAGARATPPADVHARVQLAVAEAWRAQVRRRQQVRWGAAAAAVLLLVTGGWLVQTRVGTAPPAGIAASGPAMPSFAIVAQGALVALPSDARATTQGAALARGATVPVGTLLQARAPVALRTAGGADVRLAAGTRLRVEDLRSVILERGDLYVDAAGEAQALHVRAGALDVRDIGTQFALHVADAGDVTVRVREGRVEVRGAGSPRLLAAEGARGTELRVRGADVRERALASDAGEWQWIHGAGPGFRRAGASVDEFLGWAARELGLRLHYADASIARQATSTRVLGDVSMLPAPDALAAVLASTSLAPRTVDGELRIERIAERTEAAASE